MSTEPMEPHLHPSHDLQPLAGQPTDTDHAVDAPQGELVPALDPAELQALRTELSRAQGPAYWTRLEELCATRPFQDFLKREFPSQATRWLPNVQRRDFLRLMSGSLAVAGLGACTRQPEEKIVPFAQAPEERIPGVPEHFATTMTLGGVGLGLLVESHGGRPTKVEGNADHPTSLGATDALAQAQTLGLYDPDRSHSVLRAGQISTWSEFLLDLGRWLDRAGAKAGEGLAVLVADHGSPTLAAQLAALQTALPKLRLHQWTPLHDDAVRAGTRRAFGADLVPRHELGAASVVLSVDSNFLAGGPASVRDARGFAARRRGRVDTADFNRLYALECSTDLTGAMADHRLTLKPSEVEPALRALAAELGVDVEAPTLSGRAAGFVTACAADLRAAGANALLVAGPWQPEAVHALVCAIHARLGAIGTTVTYAPQVVPTVPDHSASLRALVDALRGGEVESLVILGGNPVYDAPADLDFAGALRQVEFRAHVSLYEDETSRLCHWHVPQAHFLEDWSDAVAADGTRSVVQPLIAPLYGGRSLHQVVAALAGKSGRSAHELVRAHWREAVLPGTDDTAFERAWLQALHDGVLPGSGTPAVDVALRPLGLGPVPQAAGGLEVVLRPDACTWDGRFANNAWLQETPRPLTRLTWDNAALVSPATAVRLGVEEHDVVRVEASGRAVEAPVLVVPGHPDEVVTLHLGYGRSAAGTIGTGVGYDAYRVRTTAAPWAATATVAPTGARHRLVGVQKHPSQEDRGLVRVATFDRFKHDPEHAFEHGHHPAGDLSLYEPWVYDSYAWGMVIDLNACIGCNACMVACQSENNIPVVGKDEVAMGREMHWIRIDRYYEHSGDELDAAAIVADEVQALHQPVPCMHCELAPCEVVCPVGATTHSPEGLNEMTYNRCVGTRYCSNNCPYKVRRFNFYRYADYGDEAMALGNNPDVTVRHRGVMEKCTYCVQRINQARITAKKQDRTIREGEIVTACQAVCPTQAITFGDINDAGSAVSALRRQPHHYSLLEEAGTRPRTTYLGRMSNPNPDLAGA